MRIRNYIFKKRWDILVGKNGFFATPFYTAWRGDGGGGLL